MKIKWFEFWKWKAEVKILEEQILAKNHIIDSLRAEKNKLNQRVHDQHEQLIKLRAPERNGAIKRSRKV